MSDALQASQVKWKRLRKLVLSAALIGGAGALSIYALGGGSVILDADGLVTRQTVAVASPWPDARVRQISVRPGDWVEAGQKIAVVESAAMSRSLADLAAEQARMTGRIAQLEGRREVVKALLPMAKVSAESANAYMDTLQKANASGLALSRSMQQMSASQVQAMEKLLSLEVERTSLETEISANRGALEQVSGAYADLQRTYGSGVLVAPASGYVGSHVGMVGEVLSAGTTPVANIYAGQSYVLAYIPENYLFNVDEGQQVSIKGRGQVTTGYIERVLPVTDALPPEFQLPNRVRGRGQLVRVELSRPQDFVLDEKVRLTSCYTDKCGLGIREIVEAALPGFLRGENSTVAMKDGPAQAAVPVASQQEAPARPELPVSSLTSVAPTAASSGRPEDQHVPLSGIVIEPSKNVHGPVTGSVDGTTPLELPVTGSLKAVSTPPKT
jgi:multidrug resistance efflux pump